MKKLKILLVMIALMMFCGAKGSDLVPKFPLQFKNHVVYPSRIEGYFYRDVSNGKIYWFVGGYFHHIVDGGTYNNLFENADNYLFDVVDFSLWFTPGVSTGPPVGNAIYLGAHLSQYGGAVYFTTSSGSGGLHWLIPNPQTMDNYHFKWSSIGNLAGPPNNISPFPITGTGGYQL